MVITRLIWSPLILVLWYHRFVLTTIMSPGLIVTSMSLWQDHQHSGGGRRIQDFVPDIWACQEERSTESMWKLAPGPGVPLREVSKKCHICHTCLCDKKISAIPMKIHGLFDGVESGWRNVGCSYSSWSFSTIWSAYHLQDYMNSGLFKNLWLTNWPSNVPISVFFISYSEKNLFT